MTAMAISPCPLFSCSFFSDMMIHASPYKNPVNIDVDVFAALHTRIVEALMACRSDVYADLMTVIAKGTSESRISAVNLLFHYWPLINPHIIHRKTIQYRIHGALQKSALMLSSLLSVAWPPQLCQSLTCTDKLTRLVLHQHTFQHLAQTSCSVKRCFDPALCAKHADSAPPMALCKSCADDMDTREPLHFVRQPMPPSNVTICQNRVFI